MDEENELIALRRKKLDALRAKSIEPFGDGFEVTGSIAEVREKLEKMGVEVVGSTPEEFAAYLQAEIGKWSAVIKAAGVKVD